MQFGNWQELNENGRRLCSVECSRRRGLMSNSGLEQAYDKDDADVIRIIMRGTHCTAI